MGSNKDVADGTPAYVSRPAGAEPGGDDTAQDRRAETRHARACDVRNTQDARLIFMLSYS